MLSAASSYGTKNAKLVDQMEIEHCIDQFGGHEWYDGV